MSLFKKLFGDKKPEVPSTSPHPKAAAAAPRGAQAVVYSARSKPDEPWMIGSARVMYAFGAASELRAQLGQHNSPPAELASGILAFLYGDASQLVKDPDGLFRLAPTTRAEIVRLCVYSGDKELLLFTDQPLAKDAQYKSEGKADVAAFATMLSLKVGVGPQSDVYGARYDLPEVKMSCPNCRKLLQYAAEELMGKPCPKCHVNLPFE